MRTDALPRITADTLRDLGPQTNIQSDLQGAMSVNTTPTIAGTIVSFGKKMSVGDDGNISMGDDTTGPNTVALMIDRQSPVLSRGDSMGLNNLPKSPMPSKGPTFNV